MNKDYLKYQAQTSAHPMGLEIAKAEGSYVYDKTGKKYLDFIAGVSANTLGHQPECVKKAIHEQLDKYMHVMVYGEFVQDAPLELSKFLADKLPEGLDCTYLTNSGTEATEGALKLAKRLTGRPEVVAARNAYHGNTQGAMSVCGKESQLSAFRPLIPGTSFIAFNNLNDLEKISCRTAAVILETIQGGAGFVEPEQDYLQKVKQRCAQVGALLILDEIQSGIGRTGKLFGFEHYGVVPDILITGKGLGGGMPIGAFISSRDKMQALTGAPKLGHITTFGGHPVIAAAALATLREIYRVDLMQSALRAEELFRELLQHPLIKEVRGRGLMLAVILEDEQQVNQVILGALEKGLLLFWLLYEPKAIRITPPLNISDPEIKRGCEILLKLLDNCLQD